MKTKDIQKISQDNIFKSNKIYTHMLAYMNGQLTPSRIVTTPLIVFPCSTFSHGKSKDLDDDVIYALHFHNQCKVSSVFNIDKINSSLCCSISIFCTTKYFLTACLLQSSRLFFIPMFFKSYEFLSM